MANNRVEGTGADSMEHGVCPYFTNDWARSTQSRRTAKKKLTKLYWLTKALTKTTTLIVGDLYLHSQNRGGARRKISGALRRTSAPQSPLSTSFRWSKVKTTTPRKQF